MRRKVTNRNIVKPDIKYGSQQLEKFINSIMQDGKKNTSRTIVYGALDIIKEKENVENPLEVFDNAIKNAGPLVEVRSRRIGGANYQVPREVRTERRNALAMRWIIDATRSRKGMKTAVALADELSLAAKGEGNAVKKKKDIHKMAESNKAFAHFA
ncbi:MAG TPA: 30S ribosomal protein S7 [Candidatus Paceibacterota bacterium]|jgi:small subunit ribosomal protein S7|nr:30S ribosomal protein S7 [Candidatus Paceibacterota bacterium]